MRPVPVPPNSAHTPRVKRVGCIRPLGVTMLSDLRDGSTATLAAYRRGWLHPLFGLARLKYGDREAMTATKTLDYDFLHAH